MKHPPIYAFHQHCKDEATNGHNLHKLRIYSNLTVIYKLISYNDSYVFCCNMATRNPIHFWGVHMWIFYYINELLREIPVLAAKKKYLFYWA